MNTKTITIDTQQDAKAGSFRVESSHPIHGPLWPVSGKNEFHLHDRALAVVMAAKSVTIPMGQEIRVVHVPSGEVLFRKQSA